MYKRNAWLLHGKLAVLTAVHCENMLRSDH